MTTPALISSALAAGVALLTILSHIELWQRKEYRWDRVRAFLNSPEFSLRTRPLFLIGMALLALGWIAEIFGWLSLLGFAAHYSHRSYRHGVIRPVFTLKALTNLALAALVIAPAVYVWRDFPLGLASIIFFLPFIIAVLVGIVNIPFWLLKQAIIHRAAKKRRLLTNLTVIGITGSFGKTTTKYFLHRLLTAVGKNALASAEHRNAELPVAQDILARLKPTTAFYVAEMGAYRQGEIAAVTRLTQPLLGLLTSLGNQHLDLFGSLENIVIAKWELIQSLPTNGLAILNADDPKQVSQARAYPPGCPILWYSTQKPAGVWAEKIIIHPTRLTARLHAKSATADVELPLASEAMLQSVLAAIAAATALGIALTDLVPCLTTLKPYPRTMEIKPGASGATIIDDSYSANEAGVLVALRHLKRFPQSQKIVALRPLIELGRESKAVHERIGALLAGSSTRAYVYGHGEVAALQAGAAQADPYFHLLVYSDPEKLAAHIKERLTANSVVLLEGRLPDVVRHSVL